MPDVQLARCEIRPGKEDELREWYETLATDRFDETAATLVSEGTLTESAFIDTTGAGPSYLYVLMETEDRPDAGEITEEFQIDADHREVLARTLVGDEWEHLQPIAHLVNPER